MQLIYLSPVPWGSFSQRPHRFVTWFHATTGGNVLWLDPYLTRFPALSDLHYLRVRSTREQHDQPGWLRVMKPHALPIEPLSGSGRANALMWKGVLHKLGDFASQRATLVGIGKPSVLALSVLDRLMGCRSVYDAMDNFSTFYSGLSRLATFKRERQIARRVTVILVSSTALKRHWAKFRPDVQLVHNGLDVSALPASKVVAMGGGRKVLGYVGTVAAWFDWDWVIALAKARPTDTVRLVGPLFTHVPSALPRNVKILPPCDHRAAMEAVLHFDVGLIPFKKTDLTASVDPIKYYEYRALGIPVISTDFGEMSLRRNEEGTFLSTNHQDIPDLVEAALRYEKDLEAVRLFKEGNTWETRFAAAKLI